MRDSYNLYKDRLTGEYKESFEQVEAYGLSLNLGEDKREECMMELLDVLLSAQKEGKPVQKIVGSDITKFCDEFYRQFSGWDYIKGVADSVKRCCFLALIFTVFDVCMLWGEAPFWKMTTDIGALWIGVFFGIVTSYLLRVVVYFWMHRFRKLSMRIFRVMMAVYFVTTLVLIVAAVLLLARFEAAVYCWGVIAFCAVYLILYHILMKNERKNRRKIRFRDQVAEQVPDVLMKEFEKKNKKLAQAGKPLMTEAEFVEDQTKRFEKSRKMSKWVPVIVIGFILLCILLTWCFDGFETPADFVVFVLLESGVAGLFILLPYSVFSKADEAQNRWLEESRALGHFVGTEEDNARESAQEHTQENAREIGREAKEACNSDENKLE